MINPFRKTLLPFIIEVRFHGGLNSRQQEAFLTAANRWSEVIQTTSKSPFRQEDSRAHLVIDTRGTDLGGVGGQLGQAGPTILLRRTRLPARGMMEFDTADLHHLEAEDGLVNTIVHEMGHVLGIGSLWSTHGLVRGSGTDDPVYVGVHAAKEYAKLKGNSRLTGIPIENQGGPGTREGHWRESVFHNELMTGFLNPGDNPLSRLTVASLRDLGYQVNLEAAAPYEMPSPGRTPPREQRKCRHGFHPFAFQSRGQIAKSLHEEEYEDRCISTPSVPGSE